MARGCAALIRNSPPRHPYSRKSDNRDAIRFVNFDKYCRLEKGRVKLFAGLAWVKFRQSQPVEGKIKTRPSAKQPGTGISPFRSSRRRLSQPTLRLNGRARWGSLLATLSDGNGV